ncbi:PorP/SprF family type IX secretion system membrane protein [Aureivirga marina]|uniref:PorP/SprF family type IX secretion system membrane protein n=1 Tax=Aureivirga marina TaxID=1182451 RepID=UPI0018C96532|nr:PorP/SprF family type IX secretion system membrane protein [Aureivirga marina]
MPNKKTIILTLIVFIGLFNIQNTYAQSNEEPQDPTRIGVSINIPTHTFVKYNSFLLNPTFSFIVQKNRAATLYSRTQWVDFENSPEILMINYAGSINDRSGIGLGIYQHTTGVIKNFGGLANYAYGIRLSEKIMLSLGFNLNYFKSGLNLADIQTSGVYDPLLEEIGNESLVTFAPGLNLTFGSFDVGVYSNNLVDYNFRTKKELTKFDDKTFSGHLMYTKRFDSGKLLKNGRLSVLAQAEKEGQADPSYGGNAILEIPRVWINAGYNSFYGVSAGIGVNFAGGALSLGYTIEKGLSNELQYFGATHDIYFSYNFLKASEINLPPLDVEKSEGDRLDEILKDREERDKELNDKITSLEEKLDKLNNNNSENNNRKTKSRNGSSLIPKIKTIILDSEVEGYYLVAYNSDLEEDAEEFSTQINQSRNISGSRVIFNPYKREYYSYLNVYKSKKEALDEYYQLADDDFDGLWILRIINENKSLGDSEEDSNDENENSEEDNFDGEDYENENEDGYEEEFANNTPKAKTEEEIIKVEIKRTHNIDPGYYIIANVFSSEKNAMQFMKKLQQNNLDANYFIRPLNNFYYVYLRRVDSRSEALKLYHSSVDGTYFDEIWILLVK